MAVVAIRVKEDVQQVPRIGRALDDRIGLFELREERTGGRRIEAASLLGMGRNTITRKIAELGLDEKGVPDEAA